MALEHRETIDINLKSYWRALRRQRRLGLGTFLLGLGLFGGLSSQLKPIYTAQGQLLFSKFDDTTALTGIGTAAGGLESLLSNQTPLGTEVEVLTSHRILAKAIESVGLTDSKGKPLTVKDLRKKLGVAIQGPTDIVALQYKHPEAELALATVDTLMELYLDEEVERKQRETREAREFVASQLPQVEAELLQAEANLRQFKEANGIVDLTQETQAIAQNINTMDQQLIGLAASLNGISQQTAQMQTSFQLTLGQTLAVSVISQSPEVRGAIERLAGVEQELAAAQKVYLANHPRVLSVRAEKQLLENTINQELEAVLGDSRSIPKGLLQTSTTRETTLESFIALEIERLRLSQQFATLEQARTNYASRARLLPGLETTQGQLQRSVEVARSNYQGLLQKFQEVQLAENKPIRNAEVAQPAVIPDKAHTGRMLFLAGGGLVSLLLASVAVLLAELRDPSLKNLNEIEDSFRYPLLGVIPQSPQTQNLQAQNLQAQNLQAQNLQAQNLQGMEQPRLDAEAQRPLDIHQMPAAIREAYWMIQENLRFLQADRAVRVIVVTSARLGEGKAGVAANLAAVLGQQGHKTLLIDADLRQPHQHHLWGLNNQEGLSNVLIGQTNFRPKRSPDVPKLGILTAGQIAPNPLRLLASQHMFALVRSARNYFDYVVIDAPPLLVAADALALGSLGDGLLLVTKPGVIDRQAVTQTREILEKHEQQVLGLVVNGLNAGHFPQSRPPASGWDSNLDDGLDPRGDRVMSPGKLDKISC